MIEWKCKIIYFNLFSINSNETLLTDFEVKEILTYRNTQKDNQKDRKQFQNATLWITRSTLRYLADKPSDNYTPEMYSLILLINRVSGFLNALNNFKDDIGNKIMLTKAEILMILNNCPTTEVLIHAVLYNYYF